MKFFQTWNGAQMKLAIILLAAIVLPARGQGQSVTSQVPATTANRVEIAPVIDGAVLDEAVWQGVAPVTGFWQTTPDEGAAASEHTEVRIIYTATMLYFGVVCYDRQVENIIISDSRRDASLEETDAFVIILDTYHDQQNGFVFGTNPAGIEYDGQVTNEGQGQTGGGRQSGGSAGGFNINWDGIWEVQTNVHDKGWSAEFAIPFKTLRFTKDNDQVWGINFQRNIRRRNENSFWAPLGRQYDLYRLSQAGTLDGLNIQSQKVLQLVPYTLGDGQFNSGVDGDITGNVGLDAKYSLTPSLTLDLTYNTDFAQVEVDEQQINLERFQVFFPEKRPFFLENAGLYTVGSPGELELFFSRRIGIGPEGELVPINVGARVTGKINNFDVGLLEMQTAAVDTISDGSILPANNFSVTRVNRELPNRSAIGGMFVSRRAVGDFAADNDNQWSGAIDGRWGIGQYAQLVGFAAKTSTLELTGDDTAYRIAASYSSPEWRMGAGYMSIAENFNPEVGFMRRGNTNKVDFRILYAYRPTNLFGLQELRPHMSFQGYWDNTTGFQQNGRWHWDNHWEFKSGHEFHTGVNFTREGIAEEDGDYEIYTGIMVKPGTYNHTEIALVAFTNKGHWWDVNVRLTAGGYYGGTRVNTQPGVGVRTGDKFNISASLNRNDIELPVGSFTTNLIQMKASYAFTPQMFLQGLWQYNDKAQRWSGNLRFGWLRQANTGLYVVLNQGGIVDDDGLGIGESDVRSITMKYNRLFDVGR